MALKGTKTSLKDAACSQKGVGWVRRRMEAVGCSRAKSSKSWLLAGGVVDAAGMSPVSAMDAVVLHWLEDRTEGDQNFHPASRLEQRDG